MDNIELRYLESATAIGARIHELSGRKPSAVQREFAASCLLHGQMFWNSAAGAPIETRPLMLYYGAAAYSKALIIALTGCRPDDIRPGHGLTCFFGNGGRIGDFTVSARGLGLFQQFNDVVSPRNRISYHDRTISLKTQEFPTASSTALQGFSIRLEDCLARIPGLEDAYRLCTGREPQFIGIDFWDEDAGIFAIRIDVKRGWENKTELDQIVADVRRTAPFLSHWALRTASFNYDSTILIFDNQTSPPDVLEPDAGVAKGYSRPDSVAHAQFDPFETLPPLTGGITSVSPRGYMAPVDGHDVSEFSLMLAALLGLSSLVRYHPHSWTASVHRRRIGDKPVDDQLVPVVEEFLQQTQARFPSLIAAALLGR